MRLNSADQADVALITPSGISAARLAPYQGWETLRDKSKEIWHIWRETTSISLVSRIGTRTINRIDIPLSNNSQIDLQSYVTVFPQLPKELNQAWTAYLLQVSLPTHKDGWNVTITSNLLPMSPLIKHLSILLDIDVFRTTEIPSKDDDFWAVVEEARAIKNHIFESCITNETRGLIS